MTLDQLIDNYMEVQSVLRENQVKSAYDLIRSQIKNGSQPTLDAHFYADSTIEEAVNRLNQDSTKYKLEACRRDPIIKISIHEKPNEV